MKTLNPYTIPLESINLIEASAGTGKSWTVTLLYLRLILEKGLTVDQILVVTFTDAATKELRDAIRERLVEALDSFQAKQSGQTSQSSKQEYEDLYKQNRHGTDEEAIQRLNLAKLSLDEAAILTIHSFCQRVLNENAFEAGLPFESELMDDDYDLMLKLTDDYWRRKFQSAPQALLFKLNQKSITPDSLLNDIRGAVGKPYLDIRGPNKQDDQSNQKWQELDDYFQQAIEAWNESRDDLIAMLSDPDREKEYYKYLKDYRDEIFAELDCLSCSKVLPTMMSLTRMSWLGTREKTTKKFDSINHPFCEKWQCFLDLWKELNESSDDFLNQIRIDLLQHLQQELPKEKQRLGVLSFDDLLLQLQQALQMNEGRNNSLAEEIRIKYKAALIDEFQDTDPIQYDIFSRIYKNTNIKNRDVENNDNTDNTVFLVGDPKQAIYSFRGGDIHTYIRAKNDTLEENRYTLKKNWRSHASLITAFNTLYQLPESNPFQDNDISYINVDAGDRVTDNLRTPDKNNNSALRFWQYNQTEEKPSLDDIRNEIATAVAGDIASLLNASNEGNASIGEKPITGGDIAVLVRSHYHGDLIKSALSQKGIASVQSSKDSIFETQQASEIIRLLTAIVEPQREDDVRRALVTEFMGRNADDLIAYEKDSVAWEDILQSMFSWHYQWKQQGFLPMMRSLMKTEKLHQHLLSFDDGERRLTNVLHLSEIIHQQSRQQSLSMEETVRWLKQQQEGLNKGVSSTQKELRLESDENLVKIVTIHKSKGLEYPIIYCPFVGLGAKDKALGAAYSFYNEEKATLEIGSADAEQHKDLKRNEEKAEDTRLLYVALTRAKYQCTVVSFDEPIFNNPDRTALGWLITNGETSSPAKNKTAYYEAYKANLEKLESDSNGNISVQVLPVFDENIRYKKQDSTQKLSARTFTVNIKSQIQITSFSGLTAGAHTETADHDAFLTTALLTTTVPATSQLPPKAENEFPRGATAGNALHEIYENLDFKIPVDQQQNIIEDALSKWGFDKKHQESAQVLIQNSLEAALFETFSLDQLSLNKRLNEMEFYLPLERLQIDDLKQILFKHLSEDQQQMRNAVDTLYFDQVEGYLKGFIDLIFEYDGQYYVVDYKSNSLIGYDQESLKSTMADSHYYLQYLLYSVALHRYLQKRIPNYSWQTHVGGAYYLFIRGMSNNTAQQGVYFDKPSVELIEALDALFVRLPAHV